MVAIAVDVVQMTQDQDGGQDGDQDGDDQEQDDQHVGNLIAVEVGTTLTTSSG